MHQGGYYIEPGEIINTSIPDAHGYNNNNIKVAGSPNPLIGPFLVRDAKPGDTLAVTIQSIKPNRDTGFACKDFHPHIHNPTLPLSSRRKEYVTWHVDSTENILKPDSNYFPNSDIKLPIKPVLGCLGVASNKKVSHLSIESGIYGGNMDVKAKLKCPTLWQS